MIDGSRSLLGVGAVFGGPLAGGVRLARGWFGGCWAFGWWRATEIDPVGKAEVIAQWHQALARMAEMTFTYPDVGHSVEEVKGPEMARSILEMNWP